MPKLGSELRRRIVNKVLGRAVPEEERFIGEALNPADAEWLATRSMMEGGYKLPERLLKKPVGVGDKIPSGLAELLKENINAIPATLGLGGSLAALDLLEPKKAGADPVKNLAKIYRGIKTKPLYRYSEEEVMRKVNPKLSPKITTLTESEPVGLYFGHRLEDLPNLIEPDTITANLGKRAILEVLGEAKPGKVTKKIIRAKLLPEAKVLKINSKKEWDQILNEFRLEVDVKSASPPGWSETSKAKRDALTEWIRSKGFDAVTFPDVAGSQENLFQTVILNPNKAIGKLGNRYKLLGAAGLAASQLIGEEEAEASNVVDITKVLNKRIRKRLFPEALKFEAQVRAVRKIKPGEMSIGDLDDYFRSNWGSGAQSLFRERLKLANENLGDLDSRTQVYTALEGTLKRLREKGLWALPAAATGGGLLASQQEADASGLIPPISLISEAEAGVKGKSKIVKETVEEAFKRARDPVTGKLLHPEVEVENTAEKNLLNSLFKNWDKGKKALIGGGLGLAGGLASQQEASGLQPPINLASQALAPPLGEETRGLQPPIQFGKPSPLEGLPSKQPEVGEEKPIDLVQREPGIYALPEEKMKADIARQEAIGRGEVLQEVVEKKPDFSEQLASGLLAGGTPLGNMPLGIRSLAKAVLGEGPVQALTQPIETAKLAAEGYTRPLEELGQEVSKQALGLGLGVGAARMLTNLGLTGTKLLPKLARMAAEWSAFSLPFAMTREVTPEKKEAGVAHAIAFDPLVVGERPNKPGPPSPADVAEDLAWAGAMGAGFGLAGKVLAPIFKGGYRAFRWPLKPLQPYWAKVADLAWESHSIPTIAGIGAAGATIGALTSEEPLEGALKGAGLALGGKTLIESGHLPNPLARKLTQVVQGQKGLTTEKMFKTLGETFQPAIERLRKGGTKAKQIAASFRNARVQETFFRNISGKINKYSEELLPSESIEMMRGLSGTPLNSLKSSAARVAVQDINTTIGRMGLDSLYEDAALKQLGDLIASPLEKATQTLPLSTIMSYTKQFEKKGGLVSGQVNQKAVHSILDEIIHHPTVNPEMKHLAVGLYDIMAATPEATAKAASYAMETFLIDKLVKNPGVVSPVMKLGYVESKHPAIKGMYVSRDLELELEGMQKIHQIANDTFQKYFLNPWKMNKTILRPAAHFRNMFSNIILNDWGGLPFWRGDIYAESAAQLFKKGPTAKEFWRLAGDTRFTNVETFSPFKYARYEDRPWNMAYRVYESMANPAKIVYAWEEQWAKLAKYMHNRELGMSKVEAAADAVKWTFNYQEVTPAITRLRTAWWGAPFATWTSKAIPLTAETAVKHPLRFGKWIAFGHYLNGYALNQIGMSEEEWKGMKKMMPDYIGKSMMLMLPYRGAQGELKMLNLTWMIPGIGDLAEIKQKGEESPGSLVTLAFQNPVGNILAGWKLNKKFSGAPIWHDWESYPTQAAKMLNYAWQQWAPTVLPGGADWNAVYDALTERPEAPSPEEALAGQFGLRVVTISPEAAFRKKAALNKIYRAEIMQEMRRQLRFARTPEEQEEIVKGAQENLMRLSEEEEED